MPRGRTPAAKAEIAAAKAKRTAARGQLAALDAAAVRAWAARLRGLLLGLGALRRRSA